MHKCAIYALCLIIEPLSCTQRALSVDPLAVRAVESCAGLSCVISPNYCQCMVTEINV